MSGRPSPWFADMIAAAYSGDDAAIKAADAQLTDQERRELHHALLVLTRALFTKRAAKTASKRMVLTIEPEEG